VAPGPPWPKYAAARTALSSTSAVSWSTRISWPGRATPARRERRRVARVGSPRPARGSTPAGLRDEQREPVAQLGEVRDQRPDEQLTPALGAVGDRVGVDLEPQQRELREVLAAHRGADVVGGRLLRQTQHLAGDRHALPAALPFANQGDDGDDLVDLEVVQELAPCRS
jgi:hypothetical protein